MRFDLHSHPDPTSGHLRFHVAGRLDATSAHHLQAALDQAIQNGHHSLLLDLANVDYLSSAGIRVLLQTSRQLSHLGGSLSLETLSPPVRSVLQLAGLESLLTAPPPSTATTTTSPPAPDPIALPEHHLLLTRYPLDPDARLVATMVGHSPFLPQTPTRSHRHRFPPFAYGWGIGAFGDDYSDCQSRFGEFLAVHGHATTLPTDGANRPDDLVGRGDLVPEVEILHGAILRGSFTDCFQFEPDHDAPLPLTTLLTALTSILPTPSGCVIAAESAGLIGASLQHSPALPGADSALAFPTIRDWIGFTSERMHAETLLLAVGCLCQQPPPAWTDFLPAWSTDLPLHAHLHAAAFPYRPLPRTPPPLPDLVQSLFASGGPLGLLHLLRDDRPFDGLGDTLLRRGTVWIGPIDWEATP